MLGTHISGSLFWEHRGLHFFSSFSLGMAICLAFTNEKLLEMAFLI